MDAFSMFGSGSVGGSFSPPTLTPALSNDNLLDTLQSLARQNNAQSQANAQAQMIFQAEQNRIARDWQERMSNTAYQRAVADLKAAGLNPILATHSGASTPSASGASGAMGQVDNSVIGALASVAVASINSAATMANADKSFLASMFSSLTSHDAAIYAADQSRMSSLYGAGTKYYEQNLAQAIYYANEYLPKIKDFINNFDHPFRNDYSNRLHKLNK